mmetsp:Transcript_37542/g.47307  ORF Transcript_37542/g.47307 Transcript_37542/m.47307 type:complete len:470 (-) Transcript_37542:343-1752(-)
MAQTDVARRGNRTNNGFQQKQKQVNLPLDQKLPKAHGANSRVVRPRHASNRAGNSASPQVTARDRTPKTGRTPRTRQISGEQNGRSMKVHPGPATNRTSSGHSSIRQSPTLSSRKQDYKNKSQSMNSRRLEEKTTPQAWQKQQDSGDSQRTPANDTNKQARKHKLKKGVSVTTLLDDGPKGTKPGKGLRQGKRQGNTGNNFIKKMWLRSFGHYFNRDELEFEDGATSEAVRALGLTQKQLRKLKATFDSVDIDGSGSIDPDEFFEMIGEQRGPFTDALFALIDVDGSGAIDFEEFVRTTVTYCMYNKIDILKFCFDIFDLDRSGAIDEYEFIQLITVINGAQPLFPGNFLSALQQFDVNADGLIDFHEFTEMDKRYPLLFFPAFRLQDQMQRKTLGLKTWDKIHENIRVQKEIADYAAKHGGMEPPEPTSLVIKRKLFPCIYTKPQKIDTGLIDKHRPSNKIKKPSYLS